MGSSVTFNESINVLEAPKYDRKIKVWKHFKHNFLSCIKMHYFPKFWHKLHKGLTIFFSQSRIFIRFFVKLYKCVRVCVPLKTFSRILEKYWKYIFLYFQSELYGSQDFVGYGFAAAPWFSAPRKNVRF